MTKQRYANGSGWCKRGQHYLTPEEIKIHNGHKYCNEHGHQIRSKPRAKIYKLKYYNTLKTLVNTYPNT